jgi:hypothetical protein
MRCLAAREPKGIRIEVALKEKDTDEQPLWHYKLWFTQNTQYPNPGTPSIIEEEVSHQGEMILKRPVDSEKADPLLLTQTALEQVNTNRNFRPLVEFFSEVSYLHLVPQIVRNPTLSSEPTIPDIYGGQFLERIASTNQRTQEARFKHILQALQVAVPQLESLDLARDQRGVPHLEIGYRHWRNKPAKQDETQLSDGTLRLLALLWSLQERGGALLMEEPELSLHVGIVRHLAAMIHRNNTKKRQTIISTHSAELLADPSISGDETLLFIPSPNGTSVMPATHDDEIRALLDTGLPIAQAALPKTTPQESYQLAFL